MLVEATIKECRRSVAIGEGGLSPHLMYHARPPPGEEDVAPHTLLVAEHHHRGLVIGEGATAEREGSGWIRLGFEGSFGSKA